MKYFSGIPVILLALSLNAQIKQPGMHIEEVAGFPPSVAEVATAIPAFIGYTEKSGSLRFTAKRIQSLNEFENYFGKDFPLSFTRIQVDNAFKFVSASPLAASYNMYYALQQFYQNGGGDAYVVSVGDYTQPVLKKDFIKGLDVAGKEDEPALLLFPDAVNLPGNGLYEVQQAALSQADEHGDRFAVLDTKPVQNSLAAVSQEFRNNIGSGHLRSGAAYIPWIQLPVPPVALLLAHWKDAIYQGNTKMALRDMTTDPAVQSMISELESMKPSSPLYIKKQAALLSQAPVLQQLVLNLQHAAFYIPPSGSVCGVYARTDRERGVWKAPANVSLTGVTGLMYPVSNQEQDQLNIDPSGGKSINAIRAFTGKGIQIWGARTLAGNDNEWRYVPVRRFFNMVEESIRKSSSWVVFEPNTAATWVKLKGMIENYLTQLWRNGALMGSKPDQAYFVHVGLGQTMTAQDILDGKLIVEIGMAAVRPAEFTIIRIQYKMQP